MLKGVSFEYLSSCSALVGESGSGKTTLHVVISGTSEDASGGSSAGDAPFGNVYHVRSVALLNTPFRIPTVRLTLCKNVRQLMNSSR